ERDHRPRQRRRLPPPRRTRTPAAAAGAPAASGTSAAAVRPGAATLTAGVTGVPAVPAQCSAVRLRRPERIPAGPARSAALRPAVRAGAEWPAQFWPAERAGPAAAGIRSCTPWSGAERLRIEERVLRLHGLPIPDAHRLARVHR